MFYITLLHNTVVYSLNFIITSVHVLYIRFYNMSDSVMLKDTSLMLLLKLVASFRNKFVYVYVCEALTASISEYILKSLLSTLHQQRPSLYSNLAAKQQRKDDT